MITISSSELEPVKEKKLKEPKESNNCCEDRTCKLCKLKVDTETDKMKAISLKLMRATKNKWITEQSKLKYLESLQKLIVELYTDL
jgi:hypothetical protein